MNAKAMIRIAEAIHRPDRDRDRNRDQLLGARAKLCRALARSIDRPEKDRPQKKLASTRTNIDEICLGSIRRPESECPMAIIPMTIIPMAIVKAAAERAYLMAGLSSFGHSVKNATWQ
jgi:hypothetical protein